MSQVLHVGIQVADKWKYEGKVTSGIRRVAMFPDLHPECLERGPISRINPQTTAIEG